MLNKPHPGDRDCPQCGQGVIDEKLLDEVTRSLFRSSGIKHYYDMEKYAHKIIIKVWQHVEKNVESRLTVQNLISPKD
jgi:hypothetical protein